MRRALEQKGKVASRCDAASAEALALSLNVNQLFSFLFFQSAL
jgi:hypothetical protein